MARHRSKSVVQRIASEVPGHSRDDLRLETESNEARSVHNPTLSKQELHNGAHTIGRSRAYSSSGEVKPKLQTPGMPVFPLTESEKETMWLEYLDTLNYNSVLDSEDIENINDLFDDDMLNFKADCDYNIAYMRSLMGENKSLLSSLGSLMFQYDKVARGTSEFASQSTKLLNKQEDLENKTSQIDHILKLFEPLERISKTLVSSGNHIIKTGKLNGILAQVQDCLDFLLAHRSYKDSEVYIIRYRQCMTRGLTLIRNHLIEYLKAKNVAVSAKLQEKDITNLTLDIYMYSEFTNELAKQEENTKFPFLAGIIVDKCVTHEEYRGLANDVLQQYFKLRLQLTLYYVQQQQEHQLQQESEQAEPVTMVLHCQKSIAIFKKLLEKEYVLFCKFFPVLQWDSLQHQFLFDGLYSFFKQVLDPLYDDVRNKVLRESSISELCHMTNLLTSYYEFEDDISVVTGSDNKIEYGELFEPMLNDSQARLIFRIQNYIDNKLLKYKPKPEDLQLGSRKKSSDKSARRDSILEDFDRNLFPALYVPVGIALTMLSSIYELVNSMVFDDIAHYIIHSCIYMMRNGALKLAITHLGPVDAKLFYLKNLIMLKNQLNNFDIQFVRVETSLDFTSGIGELIQIFRDGELYVKYNEKGGLLELVKRSVPKVVNNMMDAKTETELELSNSVNELVTECTNVICAPILVDSKSTLKETVVQLNDNVLMKIPHYFTQIKLFIDEEDVARYLVDKLSSLIAQTYENYYSTLEIKLDSGDLKADEMDGVLEPETFFNFLNETVSGLYVESSQAVEFNEDILQDFDSEVAAETDAVS